MGAEPAEELFLVCRGACGASARRQRELRQHLPAGDACDAAYLLPRALLFERWRPARRRSRPRRGSPAACAATDGSSTGWSRTSGNREDDQVGALAGSEAAELVLEPERARGAECRESQCVGCAEGIRAALEGACGAHGGPHLVPGVEGRSRGRRVGAEPYADPGARRLAERRDAAAEQGVRAWAMGNRHVRAGED